MSSPIDSDQRDLDKRLHRYCEPLFLLDAWVTSGHSDATLNATITYVKYRGWCYAVTCRHVVEELDGIETNPSGRTILATMHSRSISRYAEFDPASGRQRTTFRSPSPEGDCEGVDIAIHPLGAAMPWAAEQKNKLPIDLDAWVEPRWAQMKLACAIGFATEHKSRELDKVASPLHVVTAEVASNLGPQYDKITLSASFEEPHGRFFSGMSGGAIFGDDGSNDLRPIGIVIAGSPGGASAWGERDSNAAFLTPNDIVITGLLLSPDRFQRWLKATGCISA